MNLSERKRNLLVFSTICVFVVGLFFIILFNRDNVSVAANTGHTCNYSVLVSNATCTQLALYKCNVCANTVRKGSTLPHSWTGPTCTDAQVCRSCGATGAPATGHSYSAATCIAAKTCKTCGVTSGTALGHDMQTLTDATCT